MRVKSRVIHITLLVVIGLFLARCNKSFNSSISNSKYNEISSKEGETDSKLEKIITPYSESLEKSMNEVINTSDMSMEKARPEGLLSNFVADLVLEEVLEIDSLEADFCLLNHGGLRAPLPTGNITVGNVYQLMPFENEVVILELSSEKILEIASYLSYSGGEPVSNISLKLNEINSLLIGGKPLQSEKTYRVVTSDYLAKGGDRMNFFSEPVSQINTGLKLRDVIMEYIREEKEKGNTLKAELDGRLS